MAEVPKSVEEFLTDGVRARIADLADRIVPADGQKPSASEVGVHTTYIDRALRVRPDRIGMLTTVLAHMERAESADVLENVEAEVLEPVVELIIACYFMSRVARRSIGYRGQVAVPIAEGESEYYLEEGDILAPVLARGPIWRDTPDARRLTGQLADAGSLG
ncbi:gluconate 2-dehydrogenase subunit 3 family protein [Salinibacterium sp. ZJ450]|uniref:gluconate 2-dehydrogenase subunit 3 family protein n=1 Tax=Salinibacterium sp. ZJ450 TaxID=2708338 RepID=UPI001420B3A4|nr:gluconate 2-dehydrogenase subunit 3 family protein [Salinibacterium sp. ZJ450]